MQEVGINNQGENCSHQSNSQIYFEIAKATVLGSVLVLLSDISSASGNLFVLAKTLIFATAILSLFMGRTQGLCLLICLLVAGRAIDLTETGEQSTLASIWIVHLGPITPSVFVCILMVLHALKNTKVVPTGIFRYATLWFAIVPTLAGIFYGNFSDSYARSYFKTDLRLPLMLFLSWHVFSAVCTSNKSASKILITTFFGALFARHAIDFLQSFKQVAELFTNAQAVSMCPAKGLIIAIAYFGILGLLYTKNTFIFSLISTCSLYLLVTYSARHLFITGALGIFALPKLVTKKQFVASIPIISLTLITAIFFLIATRPNTAHYVYLRMSTFFDPSRTTRGVDVDLNFFSAIDPVRYAEVLNIVHQSFTNGSIFWGQGYGGWYSEPVARLHIDLQNAYPPEQIALGRYFSAHDFPTHIFLKYGLSGLVMITLIWLKPIWHSLAALKTDPFQLNGRERTLWMLYAALICTVPTVILSLWWSGKGCALTGLTLALLSATPCFYSQETQKRKQPISPATAS